MPDTTRPVFDDKDRWPLGWYATDAYAENRQRAAEEARLDAEHRLLNHPNPLTMPWEDVPLKVDMPPAPKIEGFTHEQFMAEHNQEGWLSWQLSRPLTQPKRSSQPINLDRRPKTKKTPAKRPGGGNSGNAKKGAE